MVALTQFTTGISDQKKHHLRVVLDVIGPSPEKPPALATFSFRDAQGNVLEPPYRGFSHSKHYGAFRYLGKPGQSGQLELWVDITPPPGAAGVDIEIHRWQAGFVMLLEAPELETAPPAAAGGETALAPGKAADTSLASSSSAKPAAARKDGPLAQTSKAVFPDQRFRLRTTLRVAAPSPEKPPALIALSFRDAQGNVLPSPYKGIFQSKRYGAFLYLGEPGLDGQFEVTAEAAAPPGATSVEIFLYRWYAGSVSVPEEPEWLTLEQLSETLSDKQDSEKPGLDLLVSLARDVEPGEGYEVSGWIDSPAPLPERFALASVIFETRDGREVPPLPGISVSSRVGAYRYLTPSDHALSANETKFRAHAVFIAPREAARMNVRLIRWRAEEGLAVQDPEVAWLGAPDQCIAHGESGLELTKWFALQGRLRFRSADSKHIGIVIFSFKDAAGEPVLTTAEGLSTSERFLNYAYIRDDRDPDPEDVRETDFFISCKRPEGAQHVSWRLMPWDANMAELAHPPRIRELDTSADACLDGLSGQARILNDLSEEHAGILRRNLPRDPLLTNLARRRLAVHAEAITRTQEGDWLTVKANLKWAKGTLSGNRMAIHPVYFDLSGDRLEAPSLLGCAESERIGGYRYIALQEDGEPGKGWFRESFLTPPGAAYAAFYLLSVNGPAEIGVKSVTCAPIHREDIFTGLDLSELKTGQLTGLAQIADRIWDLKAQRAIYVALSWAEPKTTKYSQKARSLSNQLEPLDPGWLPALPARRPVASPDPKSVLHLFKVICPDESSGGAVRSTCIVEEQAAQGLRPVVCMPLGAVPADQDTLRDGLGEVTRNGVAVNYLNFTPIEPRALSLAKRYSFETLMYDRVVKKRKCSLIHAASGFHGYENALKGLALARANDLPLVYEVRSFHEHTWRPLGDTEKGESLTHLRQAQEDRCMAAADTVVTISLSMVENLQARGVPADKLFFVPNSIGDEFITLGGAGDIAALRDRTGLTGKTTIGYISNFSRREGHIVLLDAFTRLVARGHDLHLVMVGDGPEREKIMEEVRARKLTGRVVMPGGVDHADIKSWYNCIDYFVVPRIRDFASDHVTPLKPFEAMSQEIPVFMSDVPVTREIAGKDHERADVFPPGDDAYLAGLIETALGKRTELKNRAAEARQWILAERTWSNTVRRYEEVYAHARAAHARHSSVERKADGSANPGY
ncbi:glycosyltransferase [Roseovarius sp. SYSU LYC5161]|uniref:glycosyltransferase n=1 Tax=Roseovarius halophilus (ex Wu et al. 2025) TaxID=3376060 RepID=UPI00399C3D17